MEENLRNRENQNETQEVPRAGDIVEVDPETTTISGDELNKLNQGVQSSIADQQKTTVGAKDCEALGTEKETQNVLLLEAAGTSKEKEGERELTMSFPVTMSS